MLSSAQIKHLTRDLSDHIKKDPHAYRSSVMYDDEISTVSYELGIIGDDQDVWLEINIVDDDTFALIVIIDTEVDQTDIRAETDHTVFEAAARLYDFGVYWAGSDPEVFDQLEELISGR